MGLLADQTSDQMQYEAHLPSPQPVINTSVPATPSFSMGGASDAPLPQGFGQLGQQSSGGSPGNGSGSPGQQPATSTSAVMGQGSPGPGLSTGGASSVGGAQGAGAAFADADFQEPGGQAHWTLREEPDFMLAKNQRTGEMGKVAMDPLSDEEMKQVMAPHGAGSLMADDPNRMRTTVSDGDMQAQPVEPLPNEGPTGADLDKRIEDILKGSQAAAIEQIKTARDAHTLQKAQVAEARRAQGVVVNQKDPEPSLLKQKNDQQPSTFIGNQGTVMFDKNGNAFYVGNGSDRAASLLPYQGGVSSQQRFDIDPYYQGYQNPQTGNYTISPEEELEMRKKTNFGQLLPPSQETPIQAAPQTTIQASDLDLKIKPKRKLY